MPEHNVSQEELQSQVREGFRSSAYRGVDGRIETMQAEDDVKVKDNLRFAAMISNNLDPYPMPKVGTVPKGVGSGSYSTTSTLNHKAKTFRGGQEMAASLPPFNGDKSQTGKVSNGMRDSRGFLQTLSNQRETEAGAKFDDDVMAAYRNGKAREMTEEAERNRLQSMPFDTKEPEMYTKSTQEHCYMLGITKAEQKPITVHAALAEGRKKAMEETLVSTGSTTRAPTKESTFDEQALLDELHKRRAESQPRKQGHQTSALRWRSTAHDHFADYDPKAAEGMNDRYARAPVPHKHQRLTEDEEASIDHADRRYASRFNNLPTETSTELYKKEGEVDRKHNNKGTFNLRNGIATMNKLSHHPRDVQTGETYSPSQVVQGQFRAMGTNPLPMRD